MKFRQTKLGETMSYYQGLATGRLCVPEQILRACHIFGTLQIIGSKRNQHCKPGGAQMVPWLLSHRLEN